MRDHNLSEEILNWNDGGVASINEDKVWRGHQGNEWLSWGEETDFKKENDKKVRGQDIRKSYP